ncbi:hypothetical protein [Rhodoferax sp. UBA5149]|uniref:hypothetical protein n=1 Tax=Rhodoferax sp. UBA5149 TaxID=1947379 RepID=UPI0025FCB6D2|nr:hypothetical protein [Rhodoferax sp. UBA5149]
MSFLKSMTTTATASALITGCTGIPYDPATNTDSTAPEIGIRVEGQRPDSVYKPNPGPADTQCLPKKSDFCPDIRIKPVDVGIRVAGTPVDLRTTLGDRNG